MSQPETNRQPEEAPETNRPETNSDNPEMDDALQFGDDAVADGHDSDAQLAEMKDQLLRSIAENDNLRKRAQRDVEDAGKYAVANFARQLISVLENLQRATQSISEEQRAQDEHLSNLASGVEMTQRELLSVFERVGIRRIDPMGEKFDHNLHQAITQIDDPKAEPGTILHVMQAGYVIHDRLLQPALVGVATRGETKKQVDTEA